MKKQLTYKVVAAALAGALVAGCAVDGTGTELGSISGDPLFEVGVCPAGWTSTAFFTVWCPDQWQLQTQTYEGTDCVRCLETTSASDVDRLCTGPWRNAELNFGCAPGYHMVYTKGGACKRCVKPAAECLTNADCFRTGCSGEICGSEDVASVCIWRPEHACYEDKYCGCRKGKCGWSMHPKLLACLAQHGD